LAAFGVRPPIFPRFSSLVLIELHKLNNQNWIRLLYKNDSKNDELWEWPIEGCPSPCSLQKLKSARRKFLMLGENNGLAFDFKKRTCINFFQNVSNHLEPQPVKKSIYVRIRILSILKFINFLALIVLLSLISASLAIYIIWGNDQRKIMVEF
jgi:hypothetical protein